MLREAKAERGDEAVKEGRYRIAYSTTLRPVIVAVFHDAVDLPGRRVR